MGDCIGLNHIPERSVPAQFPKKVRKGGEIGIDLSLPLVNKNPEGGVYGGDGIPSV